MSYTDSSAEILRDTLHTDWNLTDPLLRDPTGTTDSVIEGTQYVYFFDRKQIVKNEKAKAVVVEKINHEGDENRIVHPNFSEQADIYEITLHLRVTSVNPEQFDVWLVNMDNMAAETIKILKTIYDPSSKPPTGVFFQTKSDWIKEDVYVSGSQPELRRKLRFTLTRLVASLDNTFLGFGGVLVFSVGSEGDTPPSVSFQYQEVSDVTINEGYDELLVLTKDQTRGVGVAQTVRGVFSGTFSALMNANEDNIVGSTTDKIQNIYKPQNNANIIGQIPEIVFLNNNNDTSSPLQTLTTTSFVKITNVEKIDGESAILKYKLSGILTRPTTYQVLP